MLAKTIMESAAKVGIFDYETTVQQTSMFACVFADMGMIACRRDIERLRKITAR